MKEDEGNKSETFALSSLWNSRRGKKVFVYRHSQRSMYTILLLLCGDIESCQTRRVWFWWFYKHQRYENRAPECTWFI